MQRCQHRLKKFLQIHELFAKDMAISKEFPMLASPRLYLVILSIYGKGPSFKKVLVGAENNCQVQTH